MTTSDPQMDVAPDSLPRRPHTPVMDLWSRIADDRVSLFNTMVTSLPEPPYDRPMKRQVDLTKRRAVDLCRVATMLCRVV